MNNKMLLVLLAATAVTVAFGPFLVPVVPGEFVVMKAGGVGAGAGNITNGGVHGVDWTAAGSGEVDLKVDKDGSVNRFNIELFVDTNNNEKFDQGEKMIFEGPLYMIQKSYSFKINDGSHIRLNYWYQPEKTFDVGDRINRANLYLNFGDSLPKS